MASETLTTGKSPSQTALSETKLYKKGLADYVVNVSEGCLHGCKFCFNKSAPQYTFDPGGKLADAGVEDAAEEWGEFVLYREDLPQNLIDDIEREANHWNHSRRGQGVTMLSIATDPYMDPKSAQLTGASVSILAAHERPVRVLTRNPRLASSFHAPLYETLAERGLVTVGASIPTVDDDLLNAIEPHAPSSEARLLGLEQLSDLGVPVFVSMGPTYPTQTKQDLRALLKLLENRLSPTVVFHEPINPAGSNFEDCIQAARSAGLSELASELDTVSSSTEAWTDYATRHLHWVQQLAGEVGVPIHCWPDKSLLSSAPADVATWCQEWRDRPTPESIGGEAYTESYPDLPALRQQADLNSF